MGKMISFFNNKGGVGKTTSVHNFAVTLANLGKKVLIIDADLQMNLSFSFSGIIKAPSNASSDNVQSDLFEYDTHDISLADALSQFEKWNQFKDKYLAIKEFLLRYLADTPIDKPKFRKEFGTLGGYVDIILGSVDMMSLEADIFSASKGHSDIDHRTLRQFQLLVDDLKNSSDYDFILLDTAPSANSAMVALWVLLSDYFIAPVTPSVYSLQALDNLPTIISVWMQQFNNFDAKKTIKIVVKFLGLIVQQGRKYENSNNDQKFSKATMAWVEELNKQIDKYKVYANRVNTIISSEDFESVFDFEDAKPYIIAVFYDFGVHLRTLAEQQGIPVVALPENPTSNYQIVLEKTKILYHNIADSLIKLR